MIVKYRLRNILFCVVVFIIAAHIAAVPVSAASAVMPAATVSGAAAEPGLTLRPAQRDWTKIVRDAEPSVVGIIGKLSRRSKEYDEASENIVLGSGIIYKSNGYVITNCHVVDECDKIFIILSDKKVYEARLIGADESSDLALVKIDKGLLKAVEFADSSAVEVGEAVITIGTPVDFDLHNSVGLGIISGIDRGNTGFTEYRFLQTDAVANPGNSGGPLMNMDGKVLGIVEGGYYKYQGITFCIPSKTILYVVPQLLRYGKVRRADIGAALVQSITADYGLPSDSGLYFTDIAAGGPLADAGVTEDDMLIALNGVQVNTLTGYAEELMKYLPGDTAELTLQRNRARRTVQVTLTEKK